MSYFVHIHLSFPSETIQLQTEPLHHVKLSLFSEITIAEIYRKQGKEITTYFFFRMRLGASMVISTVPSECFSCFFGLPLSLPSGNQNLITPVMTNFHKTHLQPLPNQNHSQPSQIHPPSSVPFQMPAASP